MSKRTGVDRTRKERADAFENTAACVESLRDGRVTYWDGERIDDITTHPRFQVPIAMTAKDYNCDDSEYRDSRRYKTDEGGFARRIYHVPRNQTDLVERVEMMGHSAISTLTTGVFVALMSVMDQVAEVNPQHAENIERVDKYARDNDLPCGGSDHRSEGRAQAPGPRAGRF
jgi:4-hydroxybutyryl-CoA dehydratase / vinylacetyl-CoA-Delta-isomerase